MMVRAQRVLTEGRSFGCRVATRRDCKYLIGLRTKIFRARGIGPGGFEPPLPAPKAGVLPLDEGPMVQI